MTEEITLGTILKRARERISWTQQQVADKLEISRGTLYRWEHDLQHPSAFYHKQIIAVLELNEKEAGALYHPVVLAPPIHDQSIIDEDIPEIDNLPINKDLLFTDRVELVYALDRAVEQSSSEIFHVPPFLSRFFTGRDDYLQELRKLLQKDGIVALSGLGGIGKSQIALKYANNSHPGVYRTVLWVNAADSATLQRDFASLAQTLGLPEKDEQEIKPRIEAVMSWLQTHTKWLLIMDNADELPVVAPFLLAKPHGHIILTTRWQFPDKFARPFTIEAMEPDEGLAFLWKWLRVEQTEADNSVGRQIVQVLGGHALALEQAGAYIQETGISFADYLKLYEENRRSLLDQYGALGEENSDHPLTVAATIRTSLVRARELSPLSEDILHFCAFLQPDAIPEELIQHDESFEDETLAFNKGLAALQRYSLIKQNRQEKTFSIHRLTQVVLIDGMAPDVQKEWRERVLRALYASFPVKSFSANAVSVFGLSNLWQCDRLLPHILICVAWSEDEFTSVQADAVLLHWTGNYLSIRMQHTTAITLLDRALLIYEQCIGADHVLTLRCIGDVVGEYLMQHKYEQAEALCQRVLAVHEKNVGAMTIGDYNVVIGCLYSMRDTGLIFSSSRLLYQLALEQVDENLASKHPDIAPLLYWMVVLLHEQRRHEQAEALYQRTLDIQEQRLGETHPHIETTKHAYAEFLYNIGRRARPEP